jgi:GNAT superfamily N-acetyltransferase
LLLKTILIRPAVPADAETLARYNVALAEESEGLKLELETVRAGVAAVFVDAARGCYFVAEQTGRVVGQLLITHEWSDWRNGDFWWLQSVYVAPEFRRQGVFKALFDYARAEAARRPDVCGFRLYMETDNARAKSAYERLGFKELCYRVLELPPG